MLFRPFRPLNRKDGSTEKRDLALNRTLLELKDRSFSSRFRRTNSQSYLIGIESNGCNVLSNAHRSSQSYLIGIERDSELSKTAVDLLSIVPYWN